MKRAVLIPMAIAMTAVCALAHAVEPPANLVVEDVRLDGGEQLQLTWEASPSEDVQKYTIQRSVAKQERPDYITEQLNKAVNTAVNDATKTLLGDGWKEIDWKSLSEERRAAVAAARAEAAERAAEEIHNRAEEDPASFDWRDVTVVPAEQTSLVVDKLSDEATYRFRVTAVGADESEASVESAEGVQPRLQWFDGTRIWFAIIALVFCGAVVTFIGLARSGRPLKVRKIGGLEAVDEAVGRATEMGRPVLFVPGTQDMNEVQTIAGITVLNRVAKTAAEYDAKIEVPTSRSLVMTTARETVQGAFLSVGRPDAYNQDLIYYVTDEQFGYTAYLSGMIVREKPAACFYMGMFYAESLILAETGNAIGAIQVAGTAQPAQLPFFVAACDYTLIGEEFFAASAYLSGSPEELGSLKGQDVGKIIVAGIMIVGVTLATISVISGASWATNAVDYLRNTILG